MSRKACKDSAISVRLRSRKVLAACNKHDPLCLMREASLTREEIDEKTEMNRRESDLAATLDEFKREQTAGIQKTSKEFADLATTIADSLDESSHDLAEVAKEQTAGIQATAKGISDLAAIVSYYAQINVDNANSQYRIAIEHAEKQSHELVASLTEVVKFLERTIADINANSEYPISRILLHSLGKKDRTDEKSEPTNRREKTEPTRRLNRQED
ncbi:hypothetical protein V493_02148 [Pseudogymnoascus sp. VKM F-4281 (FW-2241)]|nr:hypothetical protein V493_02148 [Pseudogymnoascus sp. VKM F-4281 (FW-2241)]